MRLPSVAAKKYMSSAVEGGFHQESLPVGAPTEHRISSPIQVQLPRRTSIDGKDLHRGGHVSPDNQELAGRGERKGIHALGQLEPAQWEAFEGRHFPDGILIVVPGDDPERRTSSRGRRKP